MAVQKSRKTPSKRGMRRSHNALTSPALSEDQETGEIHLRHHVTADVFSILNCNRTHHCKLNQSFWFGIYICTEI